MPCHGEVLADRLWLRRNGGNLLIMAGGLAVAYLPQAVYFAYHPQEFTGRFEQVSIFHSGWLVAEMERTGQGAIALLAEQIRRTALVFHAVPPVTFFGPGRPLLDPLSGVLLVFGLALVVATSVRSRASFALLGAFMALLFVPALTERPRNSARLVTTAPLATLLVAVGLVRTVELLIPRARTSWWRSSH